MAVLTRMTVLAPALGFSEQLGKASFFCAG